MGNSLIKKVFYPCTNCAGDYLIAYKEIEIDDFETTDFMVSVYNYTKLKWQIIDRDFLSPLP